MDIPILIDSGIKIATGIVIGIAGSWFALGRDRRKERNAAFEPIRSRLIADKAEPSPSSKGLTAAEIDYLSSLLPIYKRRGFRRAVAEYTKAKNGDVKSNDALMLFYSDTTEIITAIDSILKYIKRH